ncbi:MAG: cytochrome c biogenesis protein CcsA [Candidatus Kariarchaeaceae archaeon]|jgi:cytochrome c biogenesis factor
MIDIGFGTDLGTIILLIAFVAFLLDAFLVLAGKHIEKWEIYSEMSLSTGFVTLLISFFYFVYSILVADYNFFYVSEYVSNNMDFLLRLSTVWSSQPGSYFFWAFLIVISYFSFRMIFRQYAHETIFWRAFVLSSLQVALLIFLALFSDPFKLNSVVPSDGLGLNPLLMNIWNVIHPPIIFISYALCMIPMVIAIARISVLENGKVPEFEGKKKLDNLFEFTVSLAWFVLSAGIIIGAYWAYITLGWGGFWAWDPVETGSLIPWLFITLYYHGKPFFRKRDFLSNYIVSMGYVSTLFITYLTRSGVVSSVHAFVPEGALEKLLSLIIPEDFFLMSIILRIIPEEKIFFLFSAILVTFLLPLILGIRSREIFKIPITLNMNDFQVSKHRTTALKISFISGLFGTYIIILGLITPVIYDIIGYIITLSPEGITPGITVGQPYYNTVITVFGGAMLLAQFFCKFYPRMEIRRKFQLLIGGVIAGVLFAISGFFYRTGDLTSLLGPGNPILELLGNFWTTSDKANFVLPLLFLGIIGLIVEFVNISLKEEKYLIQKSSQVMLHLSFLLILVGALVASNTATAATIEVDPSTNNMAIPGTTLRISIVGLEKTYPESSLHATDYDTQFMITSGNQVVGYGISRLYVDHQNRVGHAVTIIGNFLSDVYVVTVDVSDPFGNFQASKLQIKIIPYINILWFGSILLLLAIAPLTISRFILVRKAFTVEESLSKAEQEGVNVVETVNNRGKVID